eukprot:UN22771
MGRNVLNEALPGNQSNFIQIFSLFIQDFHLFDFIEGIKKYYNCKWR